MSTYHNNTKKVTSPELLTDVVYTTQADLAAGQGNQQIKNYGGGDVEVSRRSAETLPYDQDGLAVSDGDIGSAWSLRRVVTPEEPTTILNMGDGTFLDALASESAFSSLAAGHSDFFDVGDTGFSTRAFAGWYGVGEDRSIEFIEEGDKKIGFKTTTSIANNGSTVSTATVTSNANGTGIIITGLSSIIGDFHSDTTTEWNGSSNNFKQEVGRYMSVWENDTRPYRIRVAAQYKRDGTVTTNQRYTVVDSDTVLVAGFPTNYFVPNTTATNVKVQVGNSISQFFRLRGATPGKSYRVSGEFRLTEAGLDTEYADQRAFIDFNDQNDSDEPMAAYRTPYMLKQMLNRDILVDIKASNVNDGKLTNLRFSHTGEFTTRNDKNGAEQVRDPIYRTNNGELPYYQLYADGNARWKIIYKPDSNNEVNICHLASAYFTNSSDGASTTRTPVDFPTLKNANGDDYWTKASTNGVFNTLTSIDVSFASVEENRWEEFNFVSTFNIPDPDLVESFDTSANAPGQGWWDFGVWDNGYSTRGRITAEYKNIVITEEPNVCMTVRRTSDDCHADILFNEDGEVSLDSPILHTTLKEDRSVSGNFYPEYHHIDGVTSITSLYNDNPETKATTLREFIEERTVTQQSVALLNNPYDQSQNIQKFEIGEDKRSFFIKAKDTFTGSYSGNDIESLRIIVPLSQYIDEKNACQSKFNVSFKIHELQTPGVNNIVDVRPVNTPVSFVGSWTPKNKAGDNISSSFNSTGNKSLEFYSEVDKNNGLHVGGIIFTIYPGQTVEIRDINIDVTPSVCVSKWYDQIVSAGGNPAKNKRRNARQTLYEKQPLLVDAGELVTLKGKPAVKFRSHPREGETSTDFHIKHKTDRLDLGNVIEANNKASAFLVAGRTPVPETGDPHAFADYFFTFGSTGENGSISETFGIGYTTSNSGLFTSASTNMHSTGTTSGTYPSRPLSDVNNGAIHTMVANTGKTRCFINGKKVGDTNTPQNASGNNLISQGRGYMGGHGGSGQAVQDGIIQELLLFKKDVGFMRPHIESNIASHWDYNAVPTILTRIKSTTHETDSYYVSLKIDNVEWDQTEQGSITFDYFVHDESPFTGKYIHVGKGNFEGTGGAGLRYYSSEGVGPLVAGTWTKVTLNFGEQFGGINKPLNENGFIFITDSKDTTGNLVKSDGSTYGDEIALADVVAKKLNQDLNLTSTSAGYSKPSYKSGL